MNPLIFNLFASRKGPEHLIWCKKLYVGRKALEKKTKLIQSIDKEKLLKDIYILMIPTNPNNQVEIMDANYLKQPYYRKQPITIVGLAVGRGEAEDQLLRIVGDCWKKQGNADLRTFLREMIREEGIRST